ncbi:glycoside hydrolase family 76 protein [Pedobacter sp. Leaf132]|uniref:glycoside hydrolase family 76 protein n=1 Tax=Pedobacter sp. Leaf132 TaxID=2876557 RepID=UPI001E54D3D7|nr:glycoside hydrolase family 76 protein [Pedobacter sp. Leaf132]
MMKYLFFLICISFCLRGYGQELNQNTIYKSRADAMFEKIWQHYRVKKYPGLFTEHYPSEQKITLDYFQGANVNEKTVSFLWPFSGMYSAANVLVRFPELKQKYSKYLDTLSIGVWSYRDTTRSPVGYQAFPAMLEKSDRYYDDNALVCIDYLEAYLNTKDQKYILKAKEVFDFIISGWDEQLGGGVYWLEGHKDQKPACSNGMSTLAALKLYQCTNDTFYLDWGKKFYNWMFITLRNPDGIYYNDVKMNGIRNKVYYTYNTGSMLESSVLLYGFTKEPKYLNEAETVAKKAHRFFANKNKTQTSYYNIDLPWFVTVLFRGYEALYHLNGNPTYINAVASDLDKAWQNSSDKYGFLTAKWARDKVSKAKPKWLLDEACVAELYGRLSLLNIKK